MARFPRKAIIGLSIVACVVVAVVLIARQRQLPYDPSFDARFKDVAYRSGGPVILYDEGHLNTHTADGGCKPLADLVRSDGYQLRVTRQTFSPQALDGISILVIVLSRGPNEANDQTAFTDSEIATVDQWVRGGGSLLLVTDHWPYGAAAAVFTKRFGVETGNGLVEDPVQHEPTRGESHLVFSQENGRLKDHPITRGRNSTEKIERILTFTGQSLLGPPTAVSFLALSDTATERPPSPPTIQKSGGDVRVELVYGDPVTAKGRAQGIALELDKGRVVILGEAGMLRAQRESNGGLVGMNVPGYDNRQLAINIMHWLSRLL